MTMLLIWIFGIPGAVLALALFIWGIYCERSAHIPPEPGWLSARTFHEGRMHQIDGYLTEEVE